MNTLDEVLPRASDADLIKTRDNLGEYYCNCKDQLFSLMFSVKEHRLSRNRELTGDLMKGLNIGGITQPQFVDLKEESLGSVPNILFWNDHQRQIYTRVKKMEHTLLMGDYGTGLCFIILSFCFDKLTLQARP